MVLHEDCAFTIGSRMIVLFSVYCFGCYTVSVVSIASYCKVCYIYREDHVQSLGEKTNSRLPKHIDDLLHFEQYMVFLKCIRVPGIFLQNFTHP